MNPSGKVDFFFLPFALADSVTAWQFTLSMRSKDRTSRSIFWRSRQPLQAHGKEKTKEKNMESSLHDEETMPPDISKSFKAAASAALQRTLQCHLHTQVKVCRAHCQPWQLHSKQEAE